LPRHFDSINWDSLGAILRVRGFPEKWCTWMQAIFDTSRSAVVLNGIPGRWICCRRGLRQGDPLSPYLFLLVTDVLQRMIQQDEVLEHPICDGMPPVILQYADDTLILFRADIAAAKRLRSILDMFATATGLVINFHKSTLIAMHVDDDTVAAVRDALGCSLESFPQNYLGLPLSCEKLNLAAFAPLIAKADRYLSGWRAILLSPGGRVVLINAILDALPTYAMAALLLPPTIVKALDALRYSFLWDASEQVSGAWCLVAWDAVCHPKDEGGLGIRSLADQNRCLLIKLPHRLHAVDDNPWARWVWWVAGDRPASALAARNLPGGHWKALYDIVPLYCSISKVQLGADGRCGFWLDEWLPLGALHAAMPALYSHATDVHISVKDVLRLGLSTVLVPRLTTVAEAERRCLATLLDSVRLNDTPDVRVLTRCGSPSGRLRSVELYKLVGFGGMQV
jgi:hypothetical protein